LRKLLDDKSKVPVYSGSTRQNTALR
jgi:hypothetical protein